MIVIRHLALAKINLSIKFEVSNSTHYEDTKDDTKCRKLGGFGSLGLTQGDWKSRHLIEHIRVPISPPQLLCP